MNELGALACFGLMTGYWGTHLILELLKKRGKKNELSV